MRTLNEIAETLRTALPEEDIVMLIKDRLVHEILEGGYYIKEYDNGVYVYNYEYSVMFGTKGNKNATIKK